MNRGEMRSCAGIRVHVIVMALDIHIAAACRERLALPAPSDGEGAVIRWPLARPSTLHFFIKAAAWQISKGRRRHWLWRNVLGMAPLPGRSNHVPSRAVRIFREVEWGLRVA